MTLAEETARLKEQFLANMSHEIRTPMNGIIGLTRILLKSELSEDQMRFLQSIKVCSDNPVSYTHLTLQTRDQG